MAVSNSNRGLVLDQVSISKSSKQLIEVNEYIKCGEVLTVMGPSGSGKSTLISFIGGFLNPVFQSSGKVLLNGIDVSNLPANQRRIGTLFQDDYLFPHLSITGNLMFGIPSEISKNERKEIARLALLEIGLEKMGERDPSSLSGGQRARVALMRVLVSNPHALLLDEPFSKLDMARKDQIRQLVFQKAKERDLPILLVTHDKSDAIAAGGQILSIENDLIE